jgi:hypothetical protein
LPTLSQMFTNCQRDSYFSRTDDEIYAALDRAGQFVYNAVCNENGGFFIRFDESSMTLAANTNEYSLPTWVTNILHLAERTNAADEWLEMEPDSRNNVLRSQMQVSGLLSISPLATSGFSYYGPYLDSAATIGTQLQKIRVSPAPGESHYVQLVATAKWNQITGSGSTIMLPDEGTNAMERFAAAYLVRKNGDSLAADYEAEGRNFLTMFLTWVRARQYQVPLTVDPYMDGE